MSSSIASPDGRQSNGSYMKTMIGGNTQVNQQVSNKENGREISYMDISHSRLLNSDKFAKESFVSTNHITAGTHGRFESSNQMSS